MSGPEPSVFRTAAEGVALATGLVAAGGALAVFHPRARLFGPTVWRGPTTRSAVALTFDDGPHPEYTSRIARILDAYQAKGTFFCIGKRVEQHRATAKALHEAGHELENHTYSHGTGRDLFSASLLQIDLERCQEVLGALTGKTPRYYRPAIGIRNPPVHTAARALGLTVVTWTSAARDGLFPFTPRRLTSLAKRAAPGSILALHDGDFHASSSLREQTVRNLPLLLTRLRERGLAFQTLTELLAG
jgi:peptidoglycan/xylan/chitin deacetylase (PgdA/CDA1 family)